MSILVPKTRDHIDNLIIQNNKQMYHLYANGTRYLAVPFFYARDRGFFPGISAEISLKVNPALKLRPAQIIAAATCAQNLEKYHCCLLSCHVGFGKTILSLWLIAALKTRTLIIVNRIVLLEQWVKAVQFVFPEARIQVLDGKARAVDPAADFYLAHIINVGKFNLKVGAVIVDEAHGILSGVLGRGLLTLRPEFLLGLTATPYRPDNFNELFELFFGKSKTLYYKPLCQKHEVKVIYTGIHIPMYKREDAIDWGKILAEQATNEERNEIIAAQIAGLPAAAHKILVLSKRVDQILKLDQLLHQRGIECYTMFGNKTFSEYKEEKVIIGTAQKIGTGFDAAGLRTLVLACDIEEYFIQYLGRVFRSPDIVPLIIDFVDDNPIIKKHLKTRKEEYARVAGNAGGFRGLLE